ncbi:DUF6489 family protein [Sandaracinobacter sp. RS1-74]|uniref:DUF6489 family protein n=1 Tax=Sandaracinobacteroides sayramensis TaxID=2913411 RepID=UPI001EDB0F33|nr:DUF6489 family protein [Sandaracinobacteroides sayramensis]MCG2841862.1 DUF6489 family protein [Sandaracinobacteroides sayramensis]
MKFEVEIEATPAEARAFLGLPDLTPLHEAWVERMKSFAFEGPSSDDWQKLMKQWTSGVPGVTEGLEAWQKLMLTAMNPGAARPAEKRD